jgi:RsmE family RNA methyltransferase
LYIAEQSQEQRDKSQDQVNAVTHDSRLTTLESNSVGILIGPEGGWSDTEKALFKEKDIKHLNLHDFTLRAETAAVAAAQTMSKF